MSISKAVLVEQPIDLSKVNYTLELDGESYLIWAQEEEIGFVNKADLRKVYKLEGENKEVFWKYLTGDFVAIIGEVTGGNSNFITVEKSSKINNLGEYDVLHVEVDHPKRFSKGDLLKF